MAKMLDLKTPSLPKSSHSKKSESSPTKGLPHTNSTANFMLEVATQFMSDSESKVKLSFLPKLCDFVSLFSDDDQ